MSHNKKAILRAFMDQIWNQGDFEQIDQLVASDYTIIEDRGDPWDGQTLDHDTFKQRVLYSRNAFPDLRFDIHHLIAENDKVVSQWTMSGTHLGDLPQIPATGTAFAISGMTIYQFSDHKICGHIQVFDQLAFLTQIGFFGR